MDRNHFNNLCNVGFGLFIHGAYAAAAIYCGYGILTGSLSYGVFVATLQLVSQVQAPFANISGYLPRYYAMLASAERLREAEFYAEDCEEERLSAEAIAHAYKNELNALELKDVSFHYPPREGEAESKMMADLNLRIGKGEIVAVTGPSGCGKSTLLKLLMALYPLDAGRREVELRDADGSLRTETLSAVWRGLFAYVPQGNQLMSGSIREVVSFGDAEAPDPEIWKALEAACAADFVKELPAGADTKIGERGAGLSEGQLQRLAIARAIYSGHPVLLLDEATSSLDEETERRLLENLKNVTDRTVVIVTHRMKVLEICSREIRMEEE